MTHTKLLTGQRKEGAAGKLIDRYYTFEYASKQPPNDEGVFYCGYHCAEHFLELLKLAPLPLFNPLSEPIHPRPKSEHENQAQNEHLHRNGNASTHRRHPLNQEMYDAIHLLCIAWDTPPGYGLAPILDYIKNNPALPSRTYAVFRINEIIGMDDQKRSLQTMLQKLRAHGNTLREYRFPLMNAILAQEKIESHLGE